MNRVLVIDQDRATRELLGLACLGHDVGVALAENLCEGVRLLLSVSVSLIVLDASAMRLTTREHVTLFERVAPGVPVVVSVAPSASLESRVALELAGFRVLAKPVTVEDLLEKGAALAGEARA
jgi:DNA-binding response OmpR family regulator